MYKTGGGLALAYELQFADLRPTESFFLVTILFTCKSLFSNNIVMKILRTKTWDACTRFSSKSFPERRISEWRDFIKCFICIVKLRATSCNFHSHQG